MKRVLIIYSGGSPAGLLAAGWISHFCKTPVSLYEISLNEGFVKQQPEGGIKESGHEVIRCTKIDIVAAGKENFDYVISLCREANELGKSLAGKGLHFYYSFNGNLNAVNKSNSNVEELSDLMKLYFERFCRIYLNEYG